MCARVREREREEDVKVQNLTMCYMTICCLELTGRSSNENLLALWFEKCIGILYLQLYSRNNRNDIWPQVVLEANDTGNFFFFLRISYDKFLQHLQLPSDDADDRTIMRIRIRVLYPSLSHSLTRSFSHSYYILRVDDQ